MIHKKGKRIPRIREECHCELIEKRKYRFGKGLTMQEKDVKNSLR